jgi:hypothetical protein
MDMIGNARHGVSLPYNYWSPAQWDEAARTLQLRPDKKLTDLKLYPGVADWVFGRSLHFIVQLTVPGAVEIPNHRDREERGVPIPALVKAAA